MTITEYLSATALIALIGVGTLDARKLIDDRLLRSRRFQTLCTDFAQFGRKAELKFEHPQVVWGSPFGQRVLPF